MSLVDTVCIGQYATTLELAAIGPNTLIFQFATYCVAALATACTWYADYSSQVLFCSLVIRAAQCCLEAVSFSD